MSLVAQQKDLDLICKSIKKGDILSLDIEFMREKTFYPLLCLIQINFQNRSFAIDPLSKEINLKPFIKILKSRGIIKVLHSARQDIEILFQELRIIPKSIFDTQLMANFVGYSYNISYANLVKDLLDVDLSKEQQRSNWTKRPLSNDQLEYALNDVKYLPKIYEILKKKLIENNNIKYFLEETKNVLKKKYYDVEKQDLLKKFSLNNKNSIYQGNIKTLVLWRDKVAKEKNIPRSFVLKDSVLNEIAKKDPKNSRDLNAIFRSQNINSRFAHKVLEVLQNQKKPKIKKIKYIDSRLSEAQKNALQEAQNMLKTIASEAGIRPEVIVNQADLKSIILKHLRLKKVICGWRYKIYGKFLKKIL